VRRAVNEEALGDGDISGYTINGSYQALDQMEHTVRNVATAAAHTVNQFVDAVGGHVVADLPRDLRRALADGGDRRNRDRRREQERLHFTTR
jgi:hypothetical protein